MSSIFLLFFDSHVLICTLPVPCSMKVITLSFTVSFPIIVLELVFSTSVSPTQAIAPGCMIICPSMTKDPREAFRPNNVTECVTVELLHVIFCMVNGNPNYKFLIYCFLGLLYLVSMSLIGSWSEKENCFEQHIELVYDSSQGALNDNLRLPNTDTPIHKIELLEVRFNSPVPIALLSFGFKNKNMAIKDGQYSSRTVVSVYNVSISDNTVFGNEFKHPPLLYRNMATNKKDSCPEYRLNIFAYPSMTPLSPTLAFVRLRISRFSLEGTHVDYKFEPQILKV